MFTHTSEMEKGHLQKEDTAEKTKVHFDKHLMPHQDVAKRSKTRVSLERPKESPGLTTDQAEKTRRVYSLNVLTPRETRHPFLKHPDSLSSMFNLLLMFASALEYFCWPLTFKSVFQTYPLPRCQLGPKS
jgi:hypothetical protein